MDIELLSFLICPATGRPLTLLPESKLAALNSYMRSRKLRSVSGRPVPGELEGCLVPKDGAVGYPIVGGIPLLLAEDAFSLSAIL